MCSECLNAHEIMRDAFEGHKVMPVKDFQDQDYEECVKATALLHQEVSRERDDEILLPSVSMTSPPKT